MKRRHLVFTRTSEDSPLHQCCHKFTLEPFLVKKGKKRLKKVTWQCRHHANYLQDLVENKDMWMNVYFNSAQFCSDNLPFASLIVHLQEIVSQWQHQKIPGFSWMKFIPPPKNTMMQWMSKRLISFAESSTVFRPSHKTIFGSIHTWLW